MPNLREIWNFKPENHLHWRMLNSSIANFLQYCYSAILNIELHYSKYCKKIIIFHLTLSPLSLISRLYLSIAEPSTCNPAPYHAIRNSHPQPSTTEHNQPSTISRHQARRNQHGDPRPTIHDPQPTIHNPRSTNLQSTTHDPQPEQCEYELVMERMKFWVLLKLSCEI